MIGKSLAAAPSRNTRRRTSDEREAGRGFPDATQKKDSATQ